MSSRRRTGPSFPLRLSSATFTRRGKRRNVHGPSQRSRAGKCLELLSDMLAHTHNSRGTRHRSVQEPSKVSLDPAGTELITMSASALLSPPSVTWDVGGIWLRSTRLLSLAPLSREGPTERASRSSKRHSTGSSQQPVRTWVRGQISLHCWKQLLETLVFVF